MKQVGIVFLFVIAAGIAFAQSGETRQLGTFRAIRTGEAIDVYLKKGDKESARVETENVSQSDVLTDVVGGTLRVHMRSGDYRNRGWVKVYVTYVSLDKLSAASASNIFSEGIIKVSTIDLSAASAASIEIQIEADNVTVDAGSAADITLEGKAKSMNVEAASAGSVDAYRLECEKVDARAASAGSIKINVTKTLDADASSGGSIRYRGNPSNTNTDSSSGGSVKKSS